MQRTIILPFLCVGVKLGLPRYGKDIRLRMFKNRVLRQMFDPKRRRKLHSEKLHYVCPSSDVI